MAKKAKGNRVQVVLECTEMKIAVFPVQAVMLQRRTVRTLLKEWS